MERKYTALIFLVVMWVASLTLVLVPMIGLTTTVYPPRPIYAYQIAFLVISTIIVAGYSISLGARLLYPSKKSERAILPYDE